MSKKIKQEAAQLIQFISPNILKWYDKNIYSPYTIDDNCVLALICEHSSVYIKTYTCLLFSIDITSGKCTIVVGKFEHNTELDMVKTPLFDRPTLFFFPTEILSIVSFDKSDYIHIINLLDKNIDITDYIVVEKELYSMKLTNSEIKKVFNTIADIMYIKKTLINLIAAVERHDTSKLQYLDIYDTDFYYDAQRLQIGETPQKVLRVAYSLIDEYNRKYTDKIDIEKVINTVANTLKHTKGFELYVKSIEVVSEIILLIMSKMNNTEYPESKKYEIGKMIIDGENLSHIINK